MTSKDKLTPLMRQYNMIKSKHPDKIMLFRMGDFYEAFNADAKKVSKVLNITLTSRGKSDSTRTPLAGFPYHALDSYLHKLLKAGLKVAICEQIEDPKKAKGIVKRDITEIVTPGITVNDKYLTSTENNYLGAVFFDGSTIAFAYIDISTGEFNVVEGDEQKIIDLFNSNSTSELLINENDKSKIKKLFPKYKGLITKLPDWIYDITYSKELINSHFQTTSLKGLGIEDQPNIIKIVGAIFHYINENFQKQLLHITSIRKINIENYVGLDQFTIRNLELFQRLSGETGEGTFVNVVDDTITSVGARTLKNWIFRPLLEKDEIIRRQDYVQYFIDNYEQRDKLRKLLDNISDLERLTSKISSAKINPREILQIKLSLKELLNIDKLLNGVLDFRIKDVDKVNDLIKLIDLSIENDPPLQISGGGVFKETYHPSLPELRQIAYHGKDYLLKLQNSERKRLGIPSLKISYNKIFGYYIDIRKTHQDKVPNEYIKRQTLVNSDRFITPELKEYEEKIISAEAKLLELESELYEEFVRKLFKYIPAIQENAKIIAEIDILSSFAELAIRNQWTRPEINEDNKLEIKGGRHPVVEDLFPSSESFIPNDTFIDTENDQILLITGPNMSGKSTYLRQIGLITLMAQIGCFVSAVSAKIGLVDKIFTRVGASDNLAYGESTFLTEMIETANILNTASAKSLILLDEIGRGTSTYDGLSIAWAVVEYLHNNSQVAARTLFATHYHELTELEIILDRVKNYNVNVKEYGDKIIFLRKIVPGRADKSYGIHVAKMAGVPQEIVKRANEILNNLSSTDHKLPSGETVLQPKIRGERSIQLNVFGPKEEKLRKEVGGLKIEEMTPLEALKKLDELKKGL